MPATAVREEFNAATGLKYLGGFFAYGLGLSALYAGLGVGLPCPFRWATGWECPLCGATRMGSSLLHLDLAAAFAFNPVVLIGLVVLGLLGAVWTVEVLGGPRLRVPERLRARLAGVHPTRWLVIGLSCAAVYTVLRNLL
ncbi:MAG: DUF2752 domain-containing protein [Propionibacteriaceae bacterium]